MKKSQNYVYEIRKIVFLFYRSYHLDEVHTMVVQAIQKGEIIMEYQYEVEQTKEEFMHEDQWADSLIKWLFIF